MQTYEWLCWWLCRLWASSIWRRQKQTAPRASWLFQAQAKKWAAYWKGRHLSRLLHVCHILCRVWNCLRSMLFSICADIILPRFGCTFSKYAAHFVLVTVLMSFFRSTLCIITSQNKDTYSRCPWSAEQKLNHEQYYLIPFVNLDNSTSSLKSILDIERVQLTLIDSHTSFWFLSDFWFGCWCLQQVALRFQAYRLVLSFIIRRIHCFLGPNHEVIN